MCCVLCSTDQSLCEESMDSTERNLKIQQQQWWIFWSFWPVTHCSTSQHSAAAIPSGSGYVYIVYEGFSSLETQQCANIPSPDKQDTKCRREEIKNIYLSVKFCQEEPICVNLPILSLRNIHQNKQAARSNTGSKECSKKAVVH